MTAFDQTLILLFMSIEKFLSNYNDLSRKSSMFTLNKTDNSG